MDDLLRMGYKIPHDLHQQGTGSAVCRQSPKDSELHSEPLYFTGLGIYISLSTGLRIGEICALKWSDINVADGTITVSRTIERIYIIEGEKKHTELVINTPKTKNSCREIPMSKELLSMIKPLKKVVNEDFYVLTNDERPTEPRKHAI